MANAFDHIDKNLLARFKAYHAENPHVYQAFKDLAFEMMLTGRNKYSAWTIINKIRWDQDIKTKGDDFSINNDFIAIYARLFEFHYPNFAGFFSVRSMKASGRKTSKEQNRRRRETK